MPMIYKVVAVPSNRSSLSFDKSFLGLAFLVLVSQPALVTGQETGVLEDDSFSSNWGLVVQVVVGLGVLMAVVLGLRGRTGFESVGRRGRREESQREVESPSDMQPSFEEILKAQFESPPDIPPSFEDIVKAQLLYDEELKAERLREEQLEAERLREERLKMQELELEEIMRIANEVDEEQVGEEVVDDDPLGLDSFDLMPDKELVEKELKAERERVEAERLEKQALEKIAREAEEERVRKLNQEREAQQRVARSEASEQLRELKVEYDALYKELDVLIQSIERKLLEGDLSWIKESMGSLSERISAFKRNRVRVLEDRLRQLGMESDIGHELGVLANFCKLVCGDLDSKSSEYVRFYSELQVQCVPDYIKDQSYVRDFLAQCQRTLDVLNGSARNRYFNGPAAIEGFNNACLAYNAKIAEFTQFWNNLNGKIKLCYSSVGKLINIPDSKLKKHVAELGSLHARQKAVINNCDPTGLAQRCRQLIRSFDIREDLASMRQAQREQKRKDELKDVIKQRIRNGFLKEVPVRTGKYDLSDFQIKLVHQQAREEVKRERNEALQQQRFEREQRAARLAQANQRNGAPVGVMAGGNDDNAGGWMPDEQYQAIEREERCREREEAERWREERRQEEARERERISAEIDRQHQARLERDQEEQRRREEEIRESERRLQREIQEAQEAVRRQEEEEYQRRLMM